MGKSSAGRRKGQEAPPRDASLNDQSVLAQSSQPESALQSLIYSQPRHLIRRLQQASVAIFFEETSEFDITPVQFGVLVVINEVPGIDQIGVLVVIKEVPGIDQIGVGSAIGIDRTTVVNVVDRLCARGLVTREQLARDRRVRTLHLTSEGERFLLSVAPAARRGQQRILEPLDEGERSQFIGYLQRLVWHHNGTSRAPVRPRVFDVPSGTRAAGERLQKRRGMRRTAGTNDANLSE